MMFKNLKFIYLLVGVAGMVGAIIIILKVIHLTSISNLSMVLIFSLGCMSLIVMRAGFYGFYELIRGRNDQKANVSRVT